MAEYYPLISRAVTNMGASTPEQRKALYERATNALLGQLRNSDPPLAEAEIERERLSLEAAVGRVESEAGGGVDRAMFEEVLEQARLATALPPRPSAPLPPEEPPTASHGVVGLREMSPRSYEDPREPHRLPDQPQAYPGPTGQSRAGDAERQAYPGSGPAGPDESGWDVPRDGGRTYGEAALGTVDRPRPPAPRPQSRDRRWLRGAIIGLAIASVVGLTAVAAISLKHTQADFSPKPQVAANAGDQEAKFQDRLPGEAGAAAPGGAPTNDPAAATTTAGATPAPSASATIGVLQRVILVEEPAEGTSEVKQTNGRVMWRMDSVSGGAGEPLDAAVRAEVDLADAGLKADILIRRNRDTALPASHTIETKFSATDKAANGPVRDVGVPEMRQDEAVRGTPLAGIAVPVTENLFLTGLSSLPGDVQRNLDLLRQRNWLMMALRFSNGRRAIMLIEKGGTGSRTMTDALQAWQQG
jgi:hypothetical protein